MALSNVEKKYQILLPGQGVEVFADSLVKSLLLSSVNEVIRTSFEILFVQLESADVVDRKILIRQWLEEAKNLAVDILTDSEVGDSIDDLFGSFSEVVMLEALEQLLAEKG